MSCIPGKSSSDSSCYLGCLGIQRKRDEERKSLALRLAECRRHKELEMEEHQRKLNENLLEIELRRIDYEEKREFVKVHSLNTSFHD